MENSERGYIGVGETRDDLLRRRNFKFYGEEDRRKQSRRAQLWQKLSPFYLLGPTVATVAIKSKVLEVLFMYVKQLCLKLEARSFNRQSLHYIGTSPNPYQQAISVIGKTLYAFDEDNLIPCYGFGDDVVSRYREIVPQLRLVGPTSFAPIIERAMTIVEESGGQYHVHVISFHYYKI
ncbi:F21J9.21 [Arabidopsis thaliana]|uniref:F21J9.21 n=1 Tax=Arabidopsis thaliana TaxID=3702 RepID=Q9FYK9_ARATH|nr:F21J9.21 [Arabidopsis thaliana]